MGRIFVVLDDDVETEFRKTVKRVMGSQRGALSIAIQQAVRSWIKEQPLD